MERTKQDHFKTRQRTQSIIKNGMNKGDTIHLPWGGSELGWNE